MSIFRKLEMIDPTYLSPYTPTPFFLDYPSFYEDTIYDPFMLPNFPFNHFTDPFYHHKIPPFFSGLDHLCDRVTTLELALCDDVVTERKCTWTAEVKCPFERKYKLKAEIRGSGSDDILRRVDRKYKWTAEIKGGCGSNHGKYKIHECGSGAGICSESKKDRHKKAALHPVEIEEPLDHRAHILRQAFSKRAGALANAKGKVREWLPQDAARMIQTRFRARILRRSQALRSLRDLAVAKAKLKEIRLMFNNFSYRRLIARDTEERKHFAEKIIGLLVSTDGIQGVDLMVRATRRLLLDELEAMLDVVDPQAQGKLGFIQRRRLGLLANNHTMQNEIVAGALEVVQMLDQAEKFDNDTFQACL